MFSRLTVFLVFAAILRGDPLGFETHYLNLGLGGKTIAIAANRTDGSVFVVAEAVVGSGIYTYRIVKTDSSGNVLGSFDFSFGFRPPPRWIRRATSWS